MSEAQMSSDFDHVAKGLRSVDKAERDRASKEVYGRFMARLTRRAQQRLPGRLKRRVDPESVALSAMKSFFLYEAAEGFDRLEDWQDIWRILVTITMCKCVNRIMSSHRAKRSVDREHYDTPDDPVLSGLAAGPNPVDEAIFQEEVERARNLCPVQNQPVFDLMLLGHRTEDIAVQLRVSKRLAQVRQKAIRDSLAALLPTERTSDQEVGRTDDTTNP
jgi:hypothetical protein